jgi:hypothetical protein
MPALTQCWYTRAHVPAGRRHKESDGSFSGECRYCHKPITSWGKSDWYLADGFNISRLRDSTGGNFLYVIDVVDELVVGRHPTDHIKSAAELRALREELYKAHGLDEPGCTLQIRDSGDTGHVH